MSASALLAHLVQEHRVLVADARRVLLEHDMLDLAAGGREDLEGRVPAARRAGASGQNALEYTENTVGDTTSYKVHVAETH